MVHIAIKESKSLKAVGPDNLSPIMLKHLGKIGISFLTDIFNLLNKTCHDPFFLENRQNTSTKTQLATSYRPISILSPVAKIMETLF